MGCCKRTGLCVLGRVSKVGGGRALQKGQGGGGDGQEQGCLRWFQGEQGCALLPGEVPRAFP